MIRRLVRKVGAFTIASWAWQHRGSVVRAADLARRAPTLVRDRRTDELTTEARAVLALDSAVPTDTSVRISGVEQGTVTLKGHPAGPGADAARKALVTLPAVVDVRTDDVDQPTLDDVLENVRV
jgi:hypothetical protein